VAPAPFTGRQTDNAEQWLKQFEYFCRYKGFDDARQAALFRMLMRESAADWLDTLPAEAVTADLKKAFTDRYKISEVMKYRSTKEVFSRRQQKTESIDQFVESMRKLGKVIAVDEKVILYACQSGLRPELAPYILQQKPDSLDALVEAGRMAEMTIMPPSESDSLQKITSVEEKVDRIVETLERKNSAPVDQPFQRQPRYGPPNWGQRQNFDQYRGPIDRPRSAYGYRPPTQGHSQSNWSSGQQTYPGPHGRRFPPPSRGYTPRFTNPGGMYLQRPPQNSQWGGFQNTAQGRYQRPIAQTSPRGPCTKCGRNAHENPNLCSAVNVQCWNCGRKGHLSRVCAYASPQSHHGTRQE